MFGTSYTEVHINCNYEEQDWSVEYRSKCLAVHYCHITVCPGFHICNYEEQDWSVEYRSKCLTVHYFHITVCPRFDICNYKEQDWSVECRSKCLVVHYFHITVCPRFFIRKGKACMLRPTEVVSGGWGFRRRCCCILK